MLGSKIGWLAFAIALSFSSPVSSPHAQPTTTIQAPGAASQTTISTSAPVNASTTIDVGTYAGQALMWVASVFGTTVGAVLTGLIWRLLKNAGIQGSELLRQRLQDIIVNGLNAGAKIASDNLVGKGKVEVEVKNAVVATAVEYVQAHGADTLKNLGIDPTSPEAVDAIKARIETAINDPTTPTPPVLDGPPKIADLPPLPTPPASGRSART